MKTIQNSPCYHVRPTVIVLDLLSTSSGLIKDFPSLNFASSSLTSHFLTEILKSIHQARIKSPFPRVVTNIFLLDFIRIMIVYFSFNLVIQGTGKEPN